MKLSIIIPAYNEEDNLGATLQEVLHSLSLLPEEEIQPEIIVIDDSSTDNTYCLAESFSGKGVRAIRLSRRSGSHIALRVGLDWATGDAAVCLAADGQDNPKILAAMISAWRQGKDIVWALRKRRQQESFAQKYFARLFYLLLGWFGGGSEIDLSRADFYLLDRKVINAVKACRERNTSLFGLLVWIGFNQGYVEYERRPRRFGGSKWNFKSRLHLAKDWIIAFSGLPLKMMTTLGFCIAGLGFLYAAIVVVRYIMFGSPLVGWPSIIIAILLLGGAQIMMLGIIGEYLWRTLDESRNRPAYFIAKDTSGGDFAKLSPSATAKDVDLKNGISWNSVGKA